MHTTKPRGRQQLRWLLPLFLFVVLAATFAIDRLVFPPPPEKFSQTREMMDTVVTVTVYDQDEEKANKAIEATFARMSSVEQIASTFDEHSPAYLLNTQRRLDNPPSELVEIISAAKEMYKVTGGVFDITVEPLLEVWRYKPQADVQFWELDRETQQRAIDRLMTMIGSDKLSVSETAIRLEPGMQVTLGGIAKGYIVDEGLRKLKELDIAHGLINAGGDIGAFGGKPNDVPWEIDLRNPEDSSDYVARFKIADGAIATSGNYERYFDENAEIGHIMDPRTGYSAHNSSSATIIAPTCMQADALATAVFVLGPEEGTQLIDSIDNIESLILPYDNPQQITRSDGMNTFEAE